MKIFWIIIIILIAAGLWWYYSSMPTANAPSTEPVTNTQTQTNLQPTTPTVTNKIIEVDIMSSGFTPSALNIKIGDTIKFVNKDTISHQPASAPHPAHTCFPGFDSLKGLKQGETYSFTFGVAKTCGFHDHLNPSLHGSITVQ